MFELRHLMIAASSAFVACAADTEDLDEMSTHDRDAGFVVPEGPPRWSRVVETGTMPGERTGAAVAYDADRPRLFMLGGCVAIGTGGACRAESDLWMLELQDGTDRAEWSRFATGSGPFVGINGQFLAVDANKRRLLVLLFDPLELWAVEGIDGPRPGEWVRLDAAMSTGPIRRLGAAAAYDAASDRILMFGGLATTDFQVLNDLWAIENLSQAPEWRRLDLESPPASRYSASAAYDASAGRLWISPGLNNSPETHAPRPAAINVASTSAEGFVATAPLDPWSRVFAISSAGAVLSVASGGGERGLYYDRVEHLASPDASWRSVAIEGEAPERPSTYAAAHDARTDRLWLFAQYSRDTSTEHELWVLSAASQ